MARTALERAGYSVDEAADGQHAIDCLDGRPIRAVVCDLAMPGVDGLGLLRYVRKHPTYRFAPFIVMTTETRESRREEARAAGASAWLPKPCAPSTLVTPSTAFAAEAMDSAIPELTIQHAAAQRDVFLAALAQTPEGDLTLDLSATAEVDSAGVQLLLALRRSLHEQGPRPAPASARVRPCARRWARWAWPTRCCPPERNTTR